MNHMAVADDLQLKTYTKSIQLTNWLQKKKKNPTNLFSALWAGFGGADLKPLDQTVEKNK